MSAEEAPLLRRDDVERIPGDAIGAPIPGGRYAADREVVSEAAAGAISEAERDRTYLQATVTQPLAIATFERAVPAFARARAARPQGAPGATRSGTARCRSAPWRRPRSSCGQSACTRRPRSRATPSARSSS